MEDRKGLLFPDKRVSSTTVVSRSLGRSRVPQTLARTFTSAICSKQRRRFFFDLQISEPSDRFKYISPVVERASEKLNQSNIPRSSLFSVVKAQIDGVDVDRVYFSKPEFLGSFLPTCELTSEELVESILWMFLIVEHIDTPVVINERFVEGLQLVISLKAIYKHICSANGTCPLFVSNFSHFKKHAREALYILSTCTYAWVYTDATPVRRSCGIDSYEVSETNTSYEEAGVATFTLVDLLQTSSVDAGRDELCHLRLSSQFQELWRRSGGKSYARILEISSKKARVLAHAFFDELSRGVIIELSVCEERVLTDLLQFPESVPFTTSMNPLLLSINRSWSTSYKIRKVTQSLRNRLEIDLQASTIYVVVLSCMYRKWRCDATSKIIVDR